MALKMAIPSLGGLEGYLRIRNIVLFRDNVGEISNYTDDSKRPKETMQVDFEVYISEEARNAGNGSIGGVQTFFVPADGEFDDLLASKAYTLVKQNPKLADAEDIIEEKKI